MLSTRIHPAFSLPDVPITKLLDWMNGERPRNKNACRGLIAELRLPHVTSTA